MDHKEQDVFPEVFYGHNSMNKFVKCPFVVDLSQSRFAPTVFHPSAFELHCLEVPLEFYRFLQYKAFLGEQAPATGAESAWVKLQLPINPGFKASTDQTTIIVGETLVARPGRPPSPVTAQVPMDQGKGRRARELGKTPQASTKTDDSMYPPPLIPKLRNDFTQFDSTYNHSSGDALPWYNDYPVNGFKHGGGNGHGEICAYQHPAAFEVRREVSEAYQEPQPNMCFQQNCDNVVSGPDEYQQLAATEGIQCHWRGWTYPEPEFLHFQEPNADIEDNCRNIPPVTRCTAEHLSLYPTVGYGSEYTYRAPNILHELQPNPNLQLLQDNERPMPDVFMSNFNALNDRLPSTQKIGPQYMFNQDRALNLAPREFQSHYSSQSLMSAEQAPVQQHASSGIYPAVYVPHATPIDAVYLAPINAPHMAPNPLCSTTSRKVTIANQPRDDMSMKGNRPKKIGKPKKADTPQKFNTMERASTSETATPGKGTSPDGMSVRERRLSKLREGTRRSTRNATK